MGVHGLWELLAPVGRRVSVELLGNKKLAIDASIWIVQFLKAMRDDRGEVVRNAHLLGFFRRICKLMFLRVKPVFVFDGGTPYLKRRTVIARRRQREQAQSKIRKTAEKLLLNHLKAKKLEELVREEERGTSQRNSAKEKTARTTSAVEEQERADALLAASLAKEWDEEEDSPMVDSTDNFEEQILPVVQGKVDPSVLASLPPSMQLKLLDEMREQLVAENRQRFEKVAKAPASFSKLQIEAYLKTVAFRRDINQVQSAAAHLNAEGIPSARIASEANRQYIFSTENGEKSAGSSNNETRRDESALPSEAIQVPSPDLHGKAAGEVQTYFDDKGKKRVSRIRGMGVRMTRDLQWNLYLMKDKEARDAEVVDFDQEKTQDVDDHNAAFEKLVSERRDDETDIDWEEVALGASETGDISGPVPEKSLNISFVDDGSLHADDMFEQLVNESHSEEPQEQIEIEWEEDTSITAADASTTLRTERGEQAESVQITFEDDGLLQEDDKFNRLVSEADENVDWEEETTEKYEPPAVVVSEVLEKIVPKVDKVSEEQSQMEEAIRRSLLDYGPRKGLKPLTIQEPRSDQQNVRQSADDRRDVTHKSAEEEERARKGKGVLYEEPLEALPNGGLESDEKNAQVSQGNMHEEAEVHESPPRFRTASEEEERFFEAEESAVRRAFYEDQREKLVQEENELRAEQKRNERNAESVTNEMFAECQELLQLFGLPYVIAPMEAEAQCAFMDSASLVDGVITDDSDVFLFGGRNVYKNIFDGHKYVETYYMKDAEVDLGLNREKLIRMAMLLGSDYTEGISGIGIVSAIEVVNAFPEEDGLKKLREWIESPDLMLLEKIQLSTWKSKSSKKTAELQEEKDELGEDDPTKDLDERKRIFMQKHRAVSKNWTVPDSFPSEAVFEAYTCPGVDQSTETFSWGRPDLDMLRKFCFEKFGWPKDKADELLLPALKQYDRRETQLRLDAFYSFNQRFAKIRSTRIQKAVAGITGQRNPDMMLGSTDSLSSKRKPRKQKDENGKPPKPNQKRKASTTGKDGEHTAKPRKRQSKKSQPIVRDMEPSLPENNENISMEDTLNGTTIDVGNVLNMTMSAAAGGQLVDDAPRYSPEDETRQTNIVSGEVSMLGGGFVVEEEAISGTTVGVVNIEENLGKMTTGNEENGSAGPLAAIPNFRKKRKIN